MEAKSDIIYFDDSLVDLPPINQDDYFYRWTVAVSGGRNKTGKAVPPVCPVLSSCLSYWFTIDLRARFQKQGVSKKIARVSMTHSLTHNVTAHPVADGTMSYVLRNDLGLFHRIL